MTSQNNARQRERERRAKRKIDRILRGRSTVMADDQQLEPRFRMQILRRHRITPFWLARQPHFMREYIRLHHHGVLTKIIQVYDEGRGRYYPMDPYSDEPAPWSKSTKQEAAVPQAPMVPAPMIPAPMIPAPMIPAPMVPAPMTPASAKDSLALRPKDDGSQSGFPTMPTMTLAHRPKRQPIQEMMQAMRAMDMAAPGDNEGEDGEDDGEDEEEDEDDGDQDVAEGIE